MVGRHPAVPHAHAHHRDPGGGAAELAEAGSDSRDLHVVQHVLLMDPLDDGGHELAGVGLSEGVEVVGLGRERFVLAIQGYVAISRVGICEGIKPWISSKQVQEGMVNF